MDYPKLNNFLNDLELDSKNNNFNYDLYQETQRFDIQADKSKLNKKKESKSFENISINRNNEILDINGMNRNFNFERINPQRQSRYNTEPDSTYKSSALFDLERQVQNSTLSNNRQINIFDNTQFSENFKTYRDIKNNGLMDNNDSINNKLSSREMAPNILSVPNNSWKNKI